MTFLHNPAVPGSGPGEQTHVSSLFSYLIYKDILSRVSPSDLLRAIDLPNESRREGQTLLGIPSSLDEFTSGFTLAGVNKDDYRRYVEAGRLVAKKLGFAPGASGLIVNGRVRLAVSFQLPKSLTVPCFQIVGPISSGDFTAEDYQTLQDYELAKRVQPVWNALSDVVPTFASHDR